MTSVSVSVVIPCYNVADTLTRALDSVRAQTLSVTEIICVDDASTDQTVPMIQAYIVAHPDLPIKLLRHEINRGPSATRNLGWDAATGDYIAFLDADDMWHPQKIAIQTAWLVQHPQIGLCGHVHLLNQPATRMDDFTQVPVQAFSIMPNQILLSNPFVPSSVLVRRTVTRRFEPSRRYTEDYLLWMQICFDGVGVALLSAPLVFVFKGSGHNLSQNVLRMRSGDLDNYWRLWRAKKISWARMMFLIPFSLLKFLLLLTFPGAHAAIKRQLFTQPLRDEH